MSYPTKFVKVITPIALAISLAACGGGGDSFGGKGTGTKTGTTTGTTTSTSNPDGVTASSIQLSASSRRLDSNGTTPIVISVVAKDANNAILPDAAVSFSVNNDASLLVNASSSADQGAIHTANLYPGTQENRTVTVTATSGGHTKSINIDIVGTQIKLQGPESIARLKPTEYTMQLQDSSEQPVVGDFTLSSSLGSSLPSTGTTDSNGEFTFTLTGNTGGTDTITATALGAVATKEISISDNDFTITSSSQEINIGNTETINILWEKSGAPQSGLINLHTTRGTLSASSIPVVNGVASFTISSDRAGSAEITAIVASTGLRAILNREFIATTPSYLNTQASPTVIAPNKTSRIIARVRDANDNPVKNIKVNYTVTDTINGSLKSGGLATTDSLGRAEVLYEAGDSTSGFEGVVINTYLQNFTTITDSVNLTVGGDALRIVLGTDENIGEQDVRYKKTYVVIVTDSTGNPVPNKTVDFSIAAQTYTKGNMLLVDTSTPPDGVGDEWVYNPSITCPTEDADHDGQMDAGEDINTNGTLEPTQDATITTAGTTDAEGSMTVEVIYPQSHALWSSHIITAKTLVNGTEFVENTNFGMPMLLADANNKDVPPPNVVSPYGQAASCTNPN